MPPARKHRAACGREGSTRAYNNGCRCVPCTRANTEAGQRKRERRKQREGRPILSIVDGQPAEVQSPAAPATQPATRHRRARGEMESAVTSDLAEIPAGSVPGFNTLKAAAVALAREIDNIDSRSSKAPLVKQLVDVVSKLTGKEAGDGESLEDLLASLSDPVAGPADWDPAKP